MTDFEQTQIARIIDAAGNRAREAMRILEDFARFNRNDARCSRQLKELRHDLDSALSAIPRSILLAARDVIHDVGTGIQTDREYTRGSIQEVLTANFKRIQEAMRSLEEFGKVFDSGLGRKLEELRYRAYSVERDLFLNQMPTTRLDEVNLYVLLPALPNERLAELIPAIAAGGAGMVQLREKELDDRLLLQAAQSMRRLTRDCGLLFIMNDRPDLARLANADGVHLGQDDLPVSAARSILGPDALIGVSTHSLEQLRQAVDSGASYVGVGPTFPSTTKSFEAFPGVEFLRQASKETTLPMYAIGGISMENIEQVTKTGCYRVAVSGVVIHSTDPRSACRALREGLKPPEAR